MNPEDMAADAIEEGDTIEIASQFGSIRTIAKAEQRLRRGVVSMTHMFGPLVGSGDPVADGGANLGQLVSLTEHVQPINFMPRYSAIPVNVRILQPQPA
jgi:anaerobic selenocysteine-containing dehydrogenase